MYDLTAYQRDLLYVIAGLEKAHGLGIKEEVDAYYDEYANPGRLYSNLDTLVDMGLVKKGDLDDRTNYYSLTRRGKREILARRKWEHRYYKQAAGQNLPRGSDTTDKRHRE